MSLEDICKELKPTVAIGASAIEGALTKQFIHMMGENCERPIIFALSNPTSKAKCTAKEAYKLSDVGQSNINTESLILNYLLTMFFVDIT